MRAASKPAALSWGATWGQAAAIVGAAGARAITRSCVPTRARARPAAARGVWSVLHGAASARKRWAADGLGDGGRRRARAGGGLGVGGPAAVRRRDVRRRRGRRRVPIGLPAVRCDRGGRRDDRRR